MKALLQRVGEDVPKPVTIVQCDGRIIEALTRLSSIPDVDSLTLLLYELNENYRTLISKQFGKEYEIMVFTKFKAQFTVVLDRIVSNTARMPLLNKVAVGAKDFTLQRLEAFQPVLEGVFDEAKFNAAIDAFILLLKGNLNHVVIPATGFWGRLFGRVLPVDPIITQLGEWMKDNRELFKVWAGDSGPENQE